MGAVRLHDSRPGSARRPVDEYGYGPLLERRRAGRPLDLGDLVRLPDGSRWPVVSSRVWLGPLGWRQSAAIGADRASALATPRSGRAALDRLAS